MIIGVGADRIEIGSDGHKAVTGGGDSAVHRGFAGSGKGNQSFQLWSRIANMPTLGSQGMPDQDGLVTIDTPFPTNPR